MVKVLAAMCLGLLLSSMPAQAQHLSHRSIPTAEWIAQSLHRMDQKGLLAGWDSMGHHREPLHRNHFAAATYVAYKNILTIISGLQARIDGLQNTTGGDVESVRLELEELREEIAASSHLDEDILNLLVLTRAFREELIALGADVVAMELDLTDLACRVTCQVPAFNIDEASDCDGQRQTLDKTCGR